MYLHGGLVYMYFISGMYWMMNIVTEKENIPQAVLIRGIQGYNGPGKITRALGIDRSFYGEDLTVSELIWIEESGINPQFKTSPRIGVDYAGEWKDKPWRFFV
jgi:DNA-3-methyladenine glycosylase